MTQDVTGRLAAQDIAGTVTAQDVAGTVPKVSQRYYISIQGTKTPKFKGEGVQAEGAHPLRPDTIAASRFSYEVTLPHDPATGQASGKRQHSPVTITKEWGAASPQLFQALTTNEVLPSVLFEFVYTGPMGQEVVYYTIKLTNAYVSALKRYFGDLQPAPASSALALEDVSFTFQKIEDTSIIGKTSASDDLGR